jgi:hypothetical protein
MSGCPGSISLRLVSTESGSFFFQPVQFDLQPTDFFIQPGLKRFVVLRCFGAAIGEEGWEAL